MKAAFVDTDVVSMLFKGDTRAGAYGDILADRIVGISFMTLAELERWSLERAWGPKRKAEFDEYRTHYPLLPFSDDLCSIWAAVTFSAREKARPIQTADAWIAATALHYLVCAPYAQSERLYDGRRPGSTFSVNGPPTLYLS
jgi:predicted nucleic acid-binding protein